MEFFLGLEISAWAEIGVALATLFLAFATTLTVTQMRLQQKIDRSHREMTLLVGQLHSHQESQFLFDINSTTYSPIPDRDRANAEWREYYDFWDNIRNNMYLGDSDLISILQNYLAAKNDYWTWAERGGLLNVNGVDFQRKIDRIRTLRDALHIETDRQYGILEGKINQLEHKPFWHFWR